MKALILGFAGLAMLAGPAAAAPQSKPAAPARQCFYSRDITSWREAGNQAVNLQVNNRDVYHLDLMGPCPQLRFTGERIGVKTRRGDPIICGGLDIDVLVPQPGGGLPTICPVTQITKLTPDEVKALPKGQRP
jgi:hypothetical protein